MFLDLSNYMGCIGLNLVKAGPFGHHVANAYKFFSDGFVLFKLLTLLQYCLLPLKEILSVIFSS